MGWDACLAHSGFVVFTAAAGYVLGSGETIQWAGLGWTCLGTMASSAAASTCNQVRCLLLGWTCLGTMASSAAASTCKAKFADWLKSKAKFFLTG
jgi:hypothetical protein